MITRGRSLAGGFAVCIVSPTIGEILGGQETLDSLASRAGLKVNESLLGNRIGLRQGLIQVCLVRNVRELVSVLEAKPVCYPAWFDASEYYFTGRVLSLTSEYDFIAAKALYNTHSSSNFYVFQRKGKAYVVILLQPDSTFPYVADLDAQAPPDYDF